MIQDAELVRRFVYHPPTTDHRKEQHLTVRSSMLETARVLNELLPDGREKNVVMTKLEEATFWANAALARPIPKGLEVVK